MTIHDGIIAERGRTTLARLFDPRVVAVIGFTADGGGRPPIRPGWLGPIRDGLPGADTNGPVDLALVQAGALTHALVGEAVVAGVTALVRVARRDDDGSAHEPDPIDDFARTRGVRLIDGGRLILAVPRSALWLEPPAGHPIGALRAGRVGLLEWNDRLVPSLLQAAAAQSVGVSTGLALARGVGVGVEEALAQFAVDPETDAICLGLGPIPDPDALLRALAAARVAGKPVVALRSFSPDTRTEVRPGITRGRVVETALAAQGVIFVDTPAAAVALAEILARRAGATADGGLIADLADPREVERLTDALAHRRNAAEGRPAIAVTLATGGPAASDGVVSLRRVEDIVTVLDGADRHDDDLGDPTDPVDLPQELELVLTQLPIGPLDVVGAGDFAAAAGIAILPFVTVRSGAEAIKAGLDIGFPIAAKLVSRGAPVKATSESVVLDLQRLKDLRRVVSGFQRSFGASFETALLQPQITPLVELRVGSFYDPDWGALLWIRSAGPFLDVVDDLVLAPAPLSEVQARGLLDRLATRPILDGHSRRAVAADFDAAVRAIVTVGHTAAALGPRLPDFVLHPLAVLEAGKGAFALDVRVRLAPAEAHAPSAKPRLKRRPEKRRSFP